MPLLSREAGFWGGTSSAPSPPSRPCAASADSGAARLALAGIKAYCAALMVTQYFTTFAFTTGESMQPTMGPGRWVRVDRLHRFPLKRNDFVMFASPRSPGEYSAKRVVGLVRRSFPPSWRPAALH